MRRLTMWLMLVVLLGIVAVPGEAQDNYPFSRPEAINVTVSMREIKPIIRGIGGSMVEVYAIEELGQDPSSMNFDPDQLDVLRESDLIIIVNSGPSEARERVREINPDAEILDWEDFSRNHAELKDFAGCGSCAYGWWLTFENVQSIGSAIFEKLERMGLDDEELISNTMVFSGEVNALWNAGRNSMAAIGRERSKWVAMSPEAAYIIDNLGLAVGTVGWNPDTGLVSGYDLIDIENKLRSGEYAGLVCPMEMRNEEAGQLALEHEEKTGTQIAWVKYSAGQSENPLIENAAYNAAAIAAAAAVGDVRTTSGGMPVSAHLIWALIVFGLIIALVMQNRQAYYGRGSRAPQKENRKKKKK
jgi:ABC-type Zn uptake system ZnuABC Zn-binding protein ZnuA